MGKPIKNPVSKTILEDLYVNQKLSAIKISKKLNTNPAQIYYLLGKYGIKRRDFKEMNTDFTVNHDYFKEIDSEEKAYWLGFLYADGFVTKRHQVGLALAKVDVGHIDKFKQAIESSHNIHFYKGSGYTDEVYAKLIFSSKSMSNDLERLGCVQHKTLVLTFPKKEQVPDEFIPDFIRGYIDGDGSITSGGKNHFIRIKICGTKELLTGINNYFNTFISIENNVKLEKRHDDKKIIIPLQSVLLFVFLRF